MQNLSLILALAALDAIKNIGPISGWEVVDILPTTGEPNKLYFVPKEDGSSPDAHDEYVWVSNRWEKVGSTDTIDISSKMDKNNAVGTGSFSMNRKADTYVGDRSTTFGYNCTANSSNAFACGEATEASNYSAHAEGNTTKALGRYSHTEGWGTEAYNDAGHAEGEDTKAFGPQAHAEGNTTTAGGQAAHAEGYHTSCGSSAAHAEGYYSSADGQGSHSEGNYCSASGDYSHAEGNNTAASGYVSHAGGMYTIADCSYETVVGKYNTTHSSDEDKPLFVVGNGADSDNRADALVVRQSGAVEVAGDIKIGDTSFTALEKSVADNWNGKGYNLLPFPYSDGASKSDKGITFTANDDGSVTVNGTASAVASYGVIDYSLPLNGKYRISGCPQGGSGATYELQLGDASAQNVYREYGDGIITANISGTFHFIIVIRSGQTVNNLTFKPMLVKVDSDGNYPTEYQRYAMGNVELTDKLNGVYIGQGGGYLAPGKTYILRDKAYNLIDSRFFKVIISANQSYDNEVFAYEYFGVINYTPHEGVDYRGVDTVMVTHAGVTPNPANFSVEFGYDEGGIYVLNNGIITAYMTVIAKKEDLLI